MTYYEIEETQSIKEWKVRKEDKKLLIIMAKISEKVFKALDTSSNRSLINRDAYMEQIEKIVSRK